MNIFSAQISITLIFLVGLLLQIAAFFYARQKQLMTASEQTSLFSKLLAVYSVHLAVIVGGIFGQQIDPAGKVPQAAFWLAVALSLVWNLLLVARSVSFLLSNGDSVAHLRTYLKVVASASSFLVAAALAFFFSRH